MKKIIYVDTPKFDINTNGETKQGEMFDLSRGDVKSIKEVEDEFKNSEGCFLCIYAPNKMISPYADFILGWVMKYIILDRNLKIISN
jgi:hypothetical protein